MLDSEFRLDFKKNKNSIVGWLLCCSYLYYIQNTNIISDDVFDKACKWLLDNYNDISHKYKYLITKEMLEAGSFYNLAMSQYPNGIIRCSEVLKRKTEREY